MGEGNGEVDQLRSLWSGEEAPVPVLAAAGR